MAEESLSLLSPCALEVESLGKLSERMRRMMKEFGRGRRGRARDG